MNMIDSCCRRPLSGGAFDHLRESLWPARGLEPYLTDALHPGDWIAWTLASPLVTDTRLARFSEGGELCGCPGRGGVSSAVAQVMADLPGSVWFVPDPLGNAGDPFLRDVRVEYVVVGEEIYYVEREAQVDRVASTWRHAGSAVRQMGVVTVGHVPDVAPTDDDLRNIVVSAKLIVLTAYDGEGAIFFEPA
jgi:hypothetical protein